MRELLARIDSHELAEWEAYDEIDPVGEERADLRTGIVASTFANCMKKKGGRSYKPKDFMPTFKATKKKQSPAEQIEIFRLLAARMK